MNTATEINYNLDKAYGTISNIGTSADGILQFVKNEVPKKKEPKALHELLNEMGLLPLHPLKFQP